MLRFKRTADDPDRGKLDKTAFKNIVLILVLGLFLIFVDLIISFTSGGPEIFRDKDDGQLYLIRPGADEPSEHLSLRARVEADEDIYEKDIDLTLSPYRSKEDTAEEDVSAEENASDEDRIMYELRSISSNVDADRSEKRIVLPDKLPGGESITWSRKRSRHTFLLMGITAGLVIFIYQRRQLPLEKKHAKESDSILACLPGFIHQIVLLMNAGLVLSSAFEKIVRENIRSKQKEDRYFYIRIRGIYDSICNTNSVLTTELQSFARSSGVGELMRISTIICDNAHKGTELTEKLERESESLWLSRKLKSEERGRLTETKMTLPLSIFLGVLILITVSPALIEL